MIINKDTMYREFKIYKGKGKYRKIQAPFDELKTKQRELLMQVLYGIKVHKCAYGFIPGVSIFDSAKVHLGQKWIFTLDIKDFFDSISENQVYNSLINNNISEDRAKEIASICTRYGHLVQGSPSSPHLSNIVFKPYDKKIYTLCRQLDLLYTRYADDITLSGDYDAIMAARPKIISIINKAGFQVSYKKVQTIGKHRQQNVTGVVINEFENVPRRKAMRIRALLHNIERDMANGSIKSLEDIKLKYDRFDKIYGYVTFMMSCNTKYQEYLDRANKIKELIN